MMRIHIKCLCTILFCYRALGESPEELFSFISPKEIALLKNFIQTEDFHNITLIGSENVYNENGELMEIRTLELHWPQDTEDDCHQYKSLISERGDENVRNGSTTETISIKELTALYATTSSDIEYDNNGNVTEETLVANNLKFVSTTDIKLITKSIVLESVDLVEQAIKELETVDGKLSVLRYDEQGRFISDGSHIVPEYLASITSDEGETSQYIFNEILKGFASAYIEYQGDERVIPGKLAEYLEETFNSREFYVFSGLPTGWYLPEKGFFKVVVQFDGIWDTDPVKYTVFGAKKILM